MRQCDHNWTELSIRAIICAFAGQTVEARIARYARMNAVRMRTGSRGSTASPSPQKWHQQNLHAGGVLPVNGAKRSCEARTPDCIIIKRSGRDRPAVSERLGAVHDAGTPMRARESSADYPPTDTDACPLRPVLWAAHGALQKAKTDGRRQGRTLQTSPNSTLHELELESSAEALASLPFGHISHCGSAVQQRVGRPSKLQHRIRHTHAPIRSSGGGSSIASTAPSATTSAKDN